MRLAHLVSALVLAAGAPACERAQSRETPREHGEVLALLDSGETALANGDGPALREAVNAWFALGVRDIDGALSPPPDRWLNAAAPPSAGEPPVRGAVRGPGVRQGALNAGEAVQFTRAFYAGRVSRITLRAESGAAMTLAIREKDGPLVCEHVARARPVTCEWTPVWTSDYLIEVRNLADDAARYSLVTN